MEIVRVPKKDNVWVYVDSFDRRDGRIWAVTFWKEDKLITRNAKKVKILMHAETLYLGYMKNQISAVMDCNDATVCEAVGLTLIVPKK